MKTNLLGWVKIGRRWWVIFQCRLTQIDGGGYATGREDGRT